MLLDQFSLRVCYADTDAAGLIHHARYLEFFERSRTEWLERMGAGPERLQGDLGLALALRETTVRFHKPGRLNDRLMFTHEITHRGRSQLTVEQSAYRVTHSGATLDDTPLLASATFHLVCINLTEMRSVPLPESIFGSNPTTG